MKVFAGKKSGRPFTERVPAPAWPAGSAVFHYLGPSFAVLLFARVPLEGVVWLRIVLAAAVFAAWRRPWRTFLRANGQVKTAIVALGAVLALMNYSFYVAIDRLPLGTVAAIEFLGPVVLALLGSGSARNLIAVMLASGGVYLLADARFAGDPQAFAWAFANAALFTLYIVLAHRVARIDAAGSSIDRLAVAMILAGVFITPIGLQDALPALLNPLMFAAGAGVAISSSVIPYAFDQLAMVRLPRASYALFVAILPAMAVIIGVIVLRQLPSIIELLGVALVVLGVTVHRSID